MISPTTSRRLIAADKLADCIPVVSLFSNTVDVILKVSAPSGIQKSRYYEHLKGKSYLQCFLIAVVPFFGFVSRGFQYLSDK